MQMRRNMRLPISAIAREEDAIAQCGMWRRLERRRTFRSRIGKAIAALSIVALSALATVMAVREAASSDDIQSRARHSAGIDPV